MAPSYRSGGSNRRRDRGHHENDAEKESKVPLKRWRRDFVTVVPPLVQENNASQNDIWAVELPYGMPPESHQLPQHSQDLLRAARSGRSHKRPLPEDEEPDFDPITGAKLEKKEEQTPKGFTVKTWKVVPETPDTDVNYLAKRRKGLITAVALGTTATVLTKATVRKTDAAGNEYLQDVVVPQGQQIEGEVVSQTTITDPSAPPAPPATPARRSRPSKKKKSALSRSRRRNAPPTSAPQAAGPQTEDQVGQSLPPADGIKVEDEANGGREPSGSAQNVDSEMADGSVAASDDDDEGDEEDDDEGSPGVSESPARASPDVSRLSSDVQMGGTEPPSLPAPIERIKEEGSKSGSPLKIVALATSTSNTPLVSPLAGAAFTQDSELPSTTQEGLEQVLEQVLEQKVVEQEALDHEVPEENTLQQEEAAPLDNSVPPSQTEAQDDAGKDEPQGQEQDEMLLDTYEPAKAAGSTLPEPTSTEPEPLSATEPGPQPTTQDLTMQEPPATLPEAPEASLQPVEPAELVEPEPESAVPEPAVPEPAEPEPVVPEPAVIEPAVPEKAAPEPAVPEPAASEPAVPEPAASEPAAPEPAEPTEDTNADIAITSPLSEPAAMGPEDEADMFQDLLGGLERNLNDRRGSTSTSDALPEVGEGA